MAKRLDQLHTLFAEFCAGEDEVEARAMLAYSLLVGAYFVNPKHDGRSRAEILGLAVDQLLT